MTNIADRSNSGLSKYGPVASVLVGLGSIIFFIAFLMCYYHLGMNNPYIPQGYASYVTKGSLTGKTKFIGIVYGPSSPGAGWLINSQLVPLTPRTYAEDFSGNDGVNAGDGTRIAFRIYVKLRVKHDAVKSFVEQAATLHSGESVDDMLTNTYNQNFKQQIRSYVRQSADEHPGLQLTANIPTMITEITDKTKVLIANSPYELDGPIAVGKIHYPDQVTDQVETNKIKQQEILERGYDVTITEKTAEVNRIEAEGIGEAAEIINHSINARWLRYKSIEMMNDTINSQTPTHLFIKVGPLGIPVTTSSKDN